MLVAFLNKLEHHGCGIEGRIGKLDSLDTALSFHSKAFCVITHNMLGMQKWRKFMGT